MKMNWGKGIVIAFILFAAALFAAVGFTLSQRVDLVTDNYYEKELKYQEHIDVLKETGNLESRLLIQNSEGAVVFTFPDGKTVPAGEINFYRPSDASKDFSVNVSTDGNGIQLVPTAKLDRGMWKVQVTWYSGNKKFYKEEKLFIN